MSAHGKDNKLTIVIAIIVISVGLMIWGATVEQGNFTTWEDTDVVCLIGGHANAASHIHSELRIFVDGQKQDMPSGIGINSDCMAEVHTHDRSGEIHVESVNQNPDLTLSDFFAVWDKPLDRSGYDREIVVNGEPLSGSAYTFTDGDTVEVRYQQATTTSSTATSSTTTSQD